MVYTDGTHLVADSLRELHAFAQELGLRREWFQRPPAHRHPHYDILSASKVRVAIRRGAVYRHPREIVTMSLQMH